MKRQLILFIAKKLQYYFTKRVAKSNARYLIAHKLYNERASLWSNINEDLVFKWALDRSKRARIYENNLAALAFVNRLIQVNEKSDYERL